MNIYKELSLPAQLEANSFYIISDDDYAKLYITTNDGTATKIIFDKDITSEIIVSKLLEYTENDSKLLVVDTIEQMNNLQPDSNRLILVNDILYSYNKEYDEYKLVVNELNFTLSEW